MARGWESKSIEEQIEASREEKQDSSDAAHHGSRGAGDSAQKTSLLLARTRVLKEIETTQNERYRQHLQITLTGIEKQLLALDKNVP
jgi:hypothetical protein